MKSFLIFILPNSVVRRSSQSTKIQSDQTCNYRLGTGLLKLLEKSLTLHAIKQNEKKQLLITISYYTSALS